MLHHRSAKLLFSRMLPLDFRDVYVHICTFKSIPCVFLESRKKGMQFGKENWSGAFCRVGAQFDFGDLTFPFRGRLPRSKQSNSSRG